MSELAVDIVNQQGYCRTFSLRLVREKTIRYPRSSVDCHKQAAAIISSFVGAKDCEHLAAVLLDGQGAVIGVHLIGIGTVGSISVGIRDVFKAAILGNARGIILGHNHPSGDVTPSAEDLKFTTAAVEAGKLLGIMILDHVIVALNGKTFSFHQENIL